jgi:hypothetical protein
MAWMASRLTLTARRWALALLGLVAASFAAAPAMAEAAPVAELVMFVEASCPWCARWDREVGGAYPRSEEGRRAPLRRIHISETRR